jgi:O-antigen ligase
VNPHARALATPLERGQSSVVTTFADTAIFSVVVAATIVLPLVISIAGPDVFAAPKTALAVAFAGLLIVLLAVRWAATGRAAPRWPSAILIAAAAFVAWNALAAALAIDRWQALVGERYQHQGLAAIVAYVVFFVAALTTVRDERRRMVFTVAIAVSCVLVAIYALVQRAELDPIWAGMRNDRVFSTLGNATSLAAYLVIAFPFVASLAIGRDWAWRSATAAAVVLTVAALAFTLSRGGYLGLGVGVVALGLGVWRARGHPLIGRRALVIGAAAVIIGVVAGMAISSVRAVMERVATRAVRTVDLAEGSTRMHLDQWAVGAAIVADHPLVGTGQDTYVLLFEDYRDEILPPDRAAHLRLFRPESPHNVYLATAAGAGLPALVAYAAFLIACGAVIARAIRSAMPPSARIFAAVCLAAMIVHLVADSFVTAETSASVLFWTVLGAGVAADGAPPSLARVSQ